MKKVFVLGGGTGGHIIPARCVAKELLLRGNFVQFFGDKKTASYLCSDDGFKTTLIYCSQFEKKPLKLLYALILILIGFFQAFLAIFRFKPDVIIAFGGYSSFPMLAAAVFLRKKIILHEQNAHLGKVNRLFAPFASIILTGFSQVDGLETKWQSKIKYVGNPVRSEIMSLRSVQYQPFAINLSLKNEISHENLARSEEEIIEEEMFFDEEFLDEFDLKQKMAEFERGQKKYFSKNSKKKSQKNLQREVFPDRFDKDFFKEITLKKLDSNEKNQAQLDSKIFFGQIKSAIANNSDDKNNKKMGYDLLLASDFNKKTPENLDYTNSKKYFEILVIGGSGGAKIFSEVLPKAFFNLPDFIKEQIFIYQQCRKDLVAETVMQYKNFGLKVEIADFFNDMPKKLADCDLVIARAGASSLAEFCVAKKPSILIPFALAADEHQTKNAAILANQNAAIVLSQREFTINNINQILNNLIANPALLKKISDNAGSLAVIDSADKISKLIDTFI